MISLQTINCLKFTPMCFTKINKHMNITKSPGFIKTVPSSVHSLNEHYLSIPQYTGISWGNVFQDTHGIWLYLVQRWDVGQTEGEPGGQVPRRGHGAQRGQVECVNSVQSVQCVYSLQWTGCVQCTVYTGKVPWRGHESQRGQVECMKSVKCTKCTLYIVYSVQVVKFHDEAKEGSGAR